MNRILNPPFLALLTFVALTTAACHKKTSSDFRLERYEYAPGETLDLINLSPKKRHQIWEIINPDGVSDTVVKGQAPQLTLNVLGEDGMYTVRVYDNKKEMGKSVSSEKMFMVTAVRGNVKIYGNSITSYPFSVLIDGQLFTGKHGIQYKLPVGTHVIKAWGIYYYGGPEHTLDTVIMVDSQSTKYLYLD